MKKKVRILFASFGLRLFLLQSLTTCAHGLSNWNWEWKKLCVQIVNRHATEQLFILRRRSRWVQISPLFFFYTTFAISHHFPSWLWIGTRNVFFMFTGPDKMFLFCRCLRIGSLRFDNGTASLCVGTYIWQKKETFFVWIQQMNRRESFLSVNPVVPTTHIINAN